MRIQVVAIENFIQIQGLNKIMILGDMFELGSEVRASANCRLPIEGEVYNVFFYRYDVLFK
jgi:UDP-N-acetylmuramyl pentapeptide synthase